MTQWLIAGGPTLLKLSREKHATRLLLPALVAGIYVLDPQARAPVETALADAYLAVAVFVAATLWLFYSLEQKFNVDTSALMRTHPHWQIPIAASLGVLPGCGGAIIVVSQYAQGSASFAALVTVLIATMGDAAFLLLAQAPLVGLGVLSTSWLVACVSGWLIHRVHGSDFMRASHRARERVRAQPLPQIQGPQKQLWLGLLILGLPLGVLAAFQVEFDRLALSDSISWNWVTTVGVVGCVLSSLMWGLLYSRKSYQSLVAEDRMADEETPDGRCREDVLSRVIRDTNFVLVWVASAFLLFELGVHYTGWDLSNLFQHAPWLAPLLGVLVGFLPGCGPQIIVASLYLTGAIPFSALIGNAISNDGDALFPAIALVPKAAVYATLYSAIPALLVAYSYYALFER